MGEAGEVDTFPRKGGKPWALVSDVDGVLTDGKFFYSSQGKELKQFGSHDADALAGSDFFSRVIFVSADKRGFEISKKRILDMGWDVILASPEERVKLIEGLKDRFNVCYVGDSFSDIQSFLAADFSAAPRGAFPIARNQANLQLECAGGEGALAELIFRVERKWL